MSEMRLSRREFLAYGASSAAVLTHSFPQFANKQKSSAAAGLERSLVFVHLRGGNDSYNTLVRYTDRNYYRARPNIALSGDEIIKIDGRFALNAALEEVVDLYREGRVAVFPQVGCTESLTRSHERASRIWHTACPNEEQENDWIDCFSNKTLSVSRYVLDGFDTHRNQKEEQFKALQQLSVLLKQLQPFANAIVLVYSEFGRSFEENDWFGTGHGSTGLCLAIGEVRGGMYDSVIDFRQLYSTIARDWFKQHASHVSADLFAPIDFIA